MIPIKSKKIMRNQLDSIPISHGNLIYCEDNKDVFYDYENGIRGSISCEVLANEGMRVAIPETKRSYSKLYYVELTDKFYIMDVGTNTFVEVEYAEQIQHITGEVLNLYQGYLHNEIKYFAPYTTSSSILMADSLESEDGPSSLQDYINDGRLSATGFGIALRTKIDTITISISGTRSVIINYPVGNFKESGFDFLLFRNTMFVPSNEYEVKEDVLTLIDEEDYFEAGDLLTFVFVYSVITNTGETELELDGSKLDDGSVSCAKIADSIIKLLKEANRYSGILECITSYFEGLKINVSIDEPNDTTNPTININGLGEVPIEVEGKDEVPIGLLRGIVTLIYTKDGTFKVVSTSNGDAYTIKEVVDTSQTVNTVYRLFKNDEEIGDPIEIPKMISDGTVKYCIEDGVPLPSLEVGDPYIELSIDATNKIYIPVPELSIEVETKGDGNAVSSIENKDNVVVVHKDTLYLTESNRKDFVSSSVTIAGLPLDGDISKDELNQAIEATPAPNPIHIGTVTYDGSVEVTVTSKNIADLAAHRSTCTSKTYLMGADGTGMYTDGGTYINTDGDFYVEGKPALVINDTKKAGRFYSGEEAPSSTDRINYDGYLYATRVYNAVYNDYAELFKKAYPDEEFKPGDVVVKVPGMNGYTKSNSNSDRLVVGVVSENYGHLIGGTGNEEYDKKHFVPIGLAGRNIVRVIGLVEGGDLLTTAPDGLAMKSINPVRDFGCIFGKVLNIINYEEETGIYTVEFLIMNN